ncbi:hypothetical protein OG429_01500 [Streptomyces sp. NBC_00190]|uniref:hypothetical protein n=1 Tax=unclassified Streptomyces TaxID=2593676 RepID=UPI002E2B307D|nr:hypothetical protein [Streptomyces sp. NBC_00190]WSZ38126.1 hypothetical protein OG239_04495 [Streptomyces sp. NBC_00868]
MAVLEVTLVRPDLVAEIGADTAVDRGGVYRYPVRFKRLRLDATAGDVPPVRAEPAVAVG